MCSTGELPGSHAGECMPSRQEVGRHEGTTGFRVYAEPRHVRYLVYAVRPLFVAPSPRGDRARTGVCVPLSIPMIMGCAEPRTGLRSCRHSLRELDRSPAGGVATAQSRGGHSEARLGRTHTRRGMRRVYTVGGWRLPNWGVVATVLRCEPKRMCEATRERERENRENRTEPLMRKFDFWSVTRQLSASRTDSCFLLEYCNNACPRHSHRHIENCPRARERQREYNVVNRNRYFLHKSTCIISRDTEKSTAASLVCKCKPKAPPQEPKTLCLSSNRSIGGIRCVSATTYGHTRLEQEKTLSTVPCLVVLQRRTHAPFVVLTSSKCIRSKTRIGSRLSWISAQTGVRRHSCVTHSQRVP